MFSESDLHSSSTFRELKSILYTIQSYTRKLVIGELKYFVDNLGSSRILMIRSPKPHLQQVAVDIFELCLRFGISIETQWLPQEENFRAHFLSRFIDKDDWSLNASVFNMLNSKELTNTLRTKTAVLQLIQSFTAYDGGIKLLEYHLLWTTQRSLLQPKGQGES